MSDSPSFDINALTARMHDLQGRLAGLGGMKDSEMTGHAGGGLVTAKVNPDGVLTSLRVDPSVIDPDDPQTLEDLVIAAVSSAQSTLREMRAKQVGDFTESMLGLTEGLREENKQQRNARTTDPLGALKTLADHGVTPPPSSTKDGPAPR
ncbi:YbaB/EbfC family nucleoid-associated protein [Streptomyces sp. NPDC050161]|uniref:YbaB/EbfC family nucleoid-associated protein n=1 Tax=Streptomyces sp. NPDC050161 TaxID=3365604 RepID=UPI0037942904